MTAHPISHRTDVGIGWFLPCLLLTVFAAVVTLAMPVFAPPVAVAAATINTMALWRYRRVTYAVLVTISLLALALSVAIDVGVLSSGHGSIEVNVVHGVAPPN